MGSRGSFIVCEGVVLRYPFLHCRRTISCRNVLSDFCRGWLSPMPVRTWPRLRQIHTVHKHCQLLRPHRHTACLADLRPVEAASLQSLVPQHRMQVFKTQECVLYGSHIHFIRFAAKSWRVWVSDTTGTDGACCSKSMEPRFARFQRNGRMSPLLIRRSYSAKGVHSVGWPICWN